MVSLLTRFITGNAVQVPVIDIRLIPHVDIPAVASQEDRPAAHEEEQVVSISPAAQADQ